MREFLKSFYRSFSQALAENEYVILFKKHHRSVVSFIHRRLSSVSPRGFWFTVGITFSALFFLYFLGITQDVLARDPFVQADIRIMNLIADFRDRTDANIYLFFTYLGSWPIILSLGAAVLCLLLLANKKWEALFLAASSATAIGIYNILKLIIHRARPNILYSLTPSEGFSYPSGHATMSIVFYGMLGYFIYKMWRLWWQKMLVIIIAAATIFLIGFSRMYLGVHWSSDIAAGWAIGSAVLILAVTLLSEKERFGLREDKNKKLRFSKRTIIAIGAALLLIEGLFIGYYFKTHLFIPPARSIPQAENIILPSFDSLVATTSSPEFPKLSETIVGDKMEPISLVLVASPEDLRLAFEGSGWFIAEKGVGKLLRLVSTAVFSQPYPTAPVSPAFLNAEPEAIAFNKPTDLNTMRQRHHARFWPARYSVGATPVWVATASFDNNLKYLITHEIKPDIDTERDFIKNELLNTGLVKNIQEVQLVPRFMGINQSGSQFFTDGKAYVIVLGR